MKRLIRLRWPASRSPDFSVTRVGVEEGEFERTTAYKYRLRPKSVGRLLAAG